VQAHHDLLPHSPPLESFRESEDTNEQDVEMTAPYNEAEVYMSSHRKHWIREWELLLQKTASEELESGMKRTQE